MSPYRLENRFTEPELVEWVERQNEIGGAVWAWIGGVGFGVVVGIVMTLLVTGRIG